MMDAPKRAYGGAFHRNTGAQDVNDVRDNAEATPGGASIQLSAQALQDLRFALRASYGADIDRALSDEQINNLGNLLLTILAEGLYVKAMQ